MNKPLLAIVFAATLMVINNEYSAPLLYRTLRGETSYHAVNNLYVPPSLDPESQRKLSLNLGGGRCKWQPPEYDVPEELDFQKTLIAGFPSGDKRMIFAQMEALTGWPARDEWDFEYLGMSNHPFIKANYPHHEGIWGWEDAADQVILMIRNIRKAMVEYHDILWDIGFAESYEEAAGLLDQAYSERPPVEDFREWRDERVLDEVHWYGWFIDYWMEGGLMRDMYTHKTTTAEHWNMILIPSAYPKEVVAYDVIVGAGTVVDPTYDSHCTNVDISSGCEPVAVISAEKLRDYTDGPDETAAIATVLLNDDRTGQYVIAPEAWDCIWEELIQNGKGLHTVNDRPGVTESDYNFSAEMLEAMISQLNRLIDKYGGDDWNDKATANRIVELLVEHRASLQLELNEVNSGMRTLTEKDFLGPKERALRRRELLKDQLIKLQEEENAAIMELIDNAMPALEDVTDDADEEAEGKDFSEYFRFLEQKMMERKRRTMRLLAQKQAEINAANMAP